MVMYVLWSVRRKLLFIRWGYLRERDLLTKGIEKEIKCSHKAF